MSIDSKAALENQRTAVQKDLESYLSCPRLFGHRVHCIRLPEDLRADGSAL